MSITVTLNGQSYIVPETGETGWGGNLDSFFVAIAAGCLQKTGGSFTLSAETDFGASYGLKALSYKSRTANIAGTGVVRLANLTDSVSWRNAANNADLALKVDASNNLTFNGSAIVTGSSSTFTANRVIASDSGGALSALSAGSAGQVLASNGAGVAPTFQTVSGTGTVASGTAGRLALYNTTSSAVADGYTQNSNTINVAITAHGALASTRTYTIPDAGNNADFVMTAGAQALVGVKTFSNVPVFTAGIGSTFLGASGTQGVLDFYAPTAARGRGRLLITDSTGSDSIITLSLEGSSAGNKTVTIPNDATTLVGITGVQTISGTKTMNSLTLGGNVSAGGFKLTGLAAGSSANDSVRYDQISGLTTLTGAVSMWFTSSIPSGYLSLDGTNVSRSTYAALFALWGTNFGAGDGSTTFGLPDMRRRVPMGAGGSGTGTIGNAVGNTGGEETHVLTTPELPSHSHTEVGNPSTTFNTPGTGVSAVLGSAGTGSTGNTGSGTAHNIIQPSFIVYFIVKT